MNKRTDIAFEKIKRRDPETIAELVRQHHLQLRGYVAAISVDISTVDDLSQEVFVRALERLDRVADLEDFGRFLRGIARNVVREHARWQARHADRHLELVDQVFEAPGASPTWTDSPELTTTLRNCIGRLPARSQEILRLRYWDELRADDIGRNVGLTGGAVRISLLRIREALVRCLRATLDAAEWEGA